MSHWAAREALGSLRAMLHACDWLSACPRDLAQRTTYFMVHCLQIAIYLPLGGRKPARCCSSRKRSAHFDFLCLLYAVKGAVATHWSTDGGLWNQPQHSKVHTSATPSRSPSHEDEKSPKVGTDTKSDRRRSNIMTRVTVPHEDRTRFMQFRASRIPFRKARPMACSPHFDPSMT